MRGRSGRFVVDEQSYCRGLDGKEIPLEELPKRFRLGDEVILAAEHGRVTIMRPIH